MNDLKKIGRRTLMQALASVLQIEGVSQRAPVALDTSRLVPTIGIDPGMAGYETWQAVNASAIPLVGNSQLNWVIVGNMSGSLLTNDYRQIDNGDKEYAILGLRVTITYTAAGALVDVGKTNFVSYWRQVVLGAGGIQAPESYVSMGVVEDVGGVHYYIHSFPMYIKRQVTANIEGDPNPSDAVAMAIRPIWVPAGSAFGLYIAKDDGSVWPADTTVDIAAWGVKCPKGMRPPGI